MASYLLLLAFPIILILYFKLQPQKSNKHLHPPGPPGLPFIGNLHQFDARFPHTYLHRLSKQYGPILSLKLGFRRVVVISSADVVKQIVTSHDAVFSGRPLLVSLKRLSYNGLDVAFSPYNEQWKEMRKISTIHLFSTKQLQSFRPIFKDEVSRMMKKIAMDASLSMVTDLSEMMVDRIPSSASKPKTKPSPTPARPKELGPNNAALSWRASKNLIVKGIFLGIRVTLRTHINRDTVDLEGHSCIYGSMPSL